MATKPTKKVSEKIIELFKHSNFTSLYGLRMNFTQAEFRNFTEYHKLLVSCDFSRGIVMLYRDTNKDKPLTGDEIQSL